MIYNREHIDGSHIQTALFPQLREEMHAFINSNPNYRFIDQYESIRGAIAHLCDRHPNLKPIFIRYFFSDIRNQLQQITISYDCAFSLIQQPPLNGTKLTAWVIFHENSDFIPISDHAWEDSRGNLIFTQNPDSANPYEATSLAINTLARTLRDKGSSILNNCTRTWYLINDIDSSYQGMVDARNFIFNKEGLNRDTHFIASTGIGATTAKSNIPISFNAFCNTKLNPNQVNFLYGKSNFNKSIDYGVAFERGVAIDFSDRRHVYISGTASIDNYGNIAFPYDIELQTKRMLDNINVLLHEAECTEQDIAHFIIYLRDMADAETVDRIFEDQYTCIPRIILNAAVCRPGWLIEAECMAIKSHYSPKHPDF